MGRHELRPEKRANLTKVAGVAGMAAAAATLAMTVGSGTAAAKPGDGLHKILHPSTNDSGSTAKSASTTSSSSSIKSIFNNGGLHIGKVVSPTPGLVVKAPDPANNKPWAQITGIQLPVWTVDGNGTAHAPF